jgi:ABC-type Fe3+-hydroxamate transport system substrate-binding protein
MNNECLQIKIIKERYENELKTISDRDYLEFRLKLKQTFEILIKDATNLSPIEDVTVLCNDEINLNTNKKGIVAFTTPFPGGCELQIKKEGYLTQILTPNFKFNNSVKTDTVLFHKKALNKSFVLCNIDSVSGELKILQETRPAFDQLIKIMKLHPDLIIELGWHTDSRDYDEVNKRLSQNRADVAVTYIVNNGIEKNRIVGKGYGESKLVNKCKNGVQCTEEEHRMNRRIEYKIIGFLKL